MGGVGSYPGLPSPLFSQPWEKKCGPRFFSTAVKKAVREGLGMRLGVGVISLGARVQIWKWGCISLVPRPHRKVSGLGTLLFQSCSTVNEIHSFLRT